MSVRIPYPLPRRHGARTGPMQFSGEAPGLYLSRETAIGLAAAVRILSAGPAALGGDVARACNLLQLLARLIERDLIAARN